MAGRIGKPRLDSFPGEVGSLHYIRLSFLSPPKQTLSERLLPQHTLNKSLSSGASGPQWGLSRDQAQRSPQEHKCYSLQPSLLAVRGSESSTLIPALLSSMAPGGQVPLDWILLFGVHDICLSIQSRGRSTPTPMSSCMRRHSTMSR